MESEEWGQCTKLTGGDRATPEVVLEMIRQVQWVHSCFPGGKLTLLGIARASLPGARFAFLFACHTAEQGPDFALGEALPLAASIQFCGFRGVVGAMWQVLDRDGPCLSERVYAYMMCDLKEDGEIRFKRGAASVRVAALALRGDVN